MKLFPQLPAVAGMVLFCTVVPACTGAPPPSPVAEAPTAVDAAIAPRGGSLVTADWADILGSTSAPDPWQVEPCDNPVLLCVRANGETLGTVERFSYPLSEVSWPGAVPTTPVAQRQFLDIWVADHYAAIKTDRAGADPNLQFTSIPPEPARVGSLPGLRYGYTITHPNGVVYDRTVGYVATDGDRVYVFVTGVISGDPTGFFADANDLAAFEPHLATIIEGLRL
ncbi:hypothetical protein PGN35_004350 [Nodosilinea sp. PGN35]|uniref:hypothetical protein n=1 Tax=Nodosilinea sp. PGN35 TaxID=3020489 RepID=UPI0023B22D5A|nr:hypothetical protein [Nodosilinea sp. TSF1-S3]MDF0365852.1 hypothetical protein [Nodosilinea sp. TSF1-S3]